jgi:hypothetical protein
VSEKIIEKIHNAIEQLPNDEAGVVVIDRPLSESVHNEDVLNACFGEDGIVVEGAKLVTVRENAFFRAGAGTRVSAVVSFSRHPMYWEHGYELEIYHNPCAKVSIPDEMFRFPGVKQVRRTEQPDGSFRLDTIKINLLLRRGRSRTIVFTNRAFLALCGILTVTVLLPGVIGGVWGFVTGEYSLRDCLIFIGSACGVVAGILGTISHHDWAPFLLLVSVYFAFAQIAKSLAPSVRKVRKQYPPRK